MNVNWRTGPAKGGENRWLHGQQIIIAVETQSGIEFAVVSVTVVDGIAEMYDLDGCGFIAWDFISISYWLPTSELAATLPKS